MKRPIFLTVWLVLIILSSLGSLYSYTLGVSSITALIPDYPSWALMVMPLLAAAQLVGAVMLWMWKKLGFQILVGSAVLSSLITLMISGVAAGLMTVVFAAIGVAILYYAMKPVWGSFK